MEHDELERMRLSIQRMIIDSKTMTHDLEEMLSRIDAAGTQQAGPTKGDRLYAEHMKALSEYRLPKLLPADTIIMIAGSPGDRRNKFGEAIADLYGPAAHLFEMSIESFTYTRLCGDGASTEASEYIRSAASGMNGIKMIVYLPEWKPLSFPAGFDVLIRMFDETSSAHSNEWMLRRNVTEKYEEGHWP